MSMQAAPRYASHDSPRGNATPTRNRLGGKANWAGHTVEYYGRNKALMGDGHHVGDPCILNAVAEARH